MDGRATPLGLLTLVAAALLTAGALFAAADARAAICKPVCLPPPEEAPGEEPPAEETPKPKPTVKKVLVVGVGWDTGNPETSSPLPPGRNGLYITYLQGHFTEWMARSAAPVTVPSWRASSGGEYTIAPPPVPRVSNPYDPNAGGCAKPELDAFIDAVGTRGEEKARQAGFNLGNYDYLVVQYVNRWCIGGSRDGRRILLVRPEFAMHEFGHALGLGHANDLRCEDAAGRRVPLSNRCVETEYEDPYDTMGSIVAEISYNAPHTFKVGWLNNQFFDLSAGDFSRTFTIRPFTAIPHVERALRLKDYDRATGRETTLWLEYRTELGIDHEDFTGRKFGAQQGLVVHLAADPGVSQLLDMTPGSRESPGEDRADAPLPVGQTWANPLGEMEITLNSLSPSGATVTISSRRVAVPSLRGLSVAQAEARLAAFGLRGAGWGGIADPTCTLIGLVAAQNPSPGTRILPENPVSVAVGQRGPNGSCQ
jgi:hypothetical protein